MNIHRFYLAAANYLLFWIPRSSFSFGHRSAPRGFPISRQGCTTKRTFSSPFVCHESSRLIPTNPTSETRRHSLFSDFSSIRVSFTQQKMASTTEISIQGGCDYEIDASEGLLDLILNALNLPDEGQVIACLQGFLQGRNTQETVRKSPPTLSGHIMDAVAEFLMIEARTEKKAGRRALEEASRQLLSARGTTGDEGSSDLVATILVSMTLALDQHGNSDPLFSRSRNRAIASAIAGTLTKNKKEEGIKNDQKEGAIVHSLFKTLFQVIASGENNQHDGLVSTDWHIVSGLAKALKVDSLQDDELAKDVASIIAAVLKLDDTKSDDSSMGSFDQVSTTNAAASLALAAQLQPWQVIEPADLINLAASLSLDHAAERICDAITSSSPATKAARDSVEALMEGAFESKQYRQADSYATKFFHVGGKRRFLEARYLHACSTISKVICKGALPVIDKQIERVDRAVKTMEKEGIGSTNSDSTISSTISCGSASRGIRSFTLEQLEETENADAAHRLAMLWGVEYAFDEEAILRSAQARRKKYLQWEDFQSMLLGSPPDLVSTPEALAEAMTQLENSESGNVYGFDAEWSEDDTGVDVLQVASMKCVVLLDILVLSSSVEGCNALEKTVGRMFASSTMVGFSCRQDISKLRGSRSGYEKKDNRYWLQESTGVVDLQKIVSKSDPSLTKFGLSRVCERFLGKPLDKSEQCSRWNSRPLSLRQRTYAALDAWVVRAIYDKVEV